MEGLGFPVTSPMRRIQIQTQIQFQFQLHNQRVETNTSYSSGVQTSNLNQSSSNGRATTRTRTITRRRPTGMPRLCSSSTPNYHQLQGDTDGFIDIEQRTSPNQVREEMQKCYKLIHKLGRGVVYLGSSRMGPSHPHYVKTLELGREIATLLDCTTWTGVGPGLMDAATKGAQQAKKPVGGFKIGREAGEWTSSNYHPYLPSETYLTCRFFSARKHGLVDAAVRCTSSDRTAVVALPGGVGTLDEMFEILALIQLERIGSALPIPFIVMNYDSFYSNLLAFLDDCEDWGTVSKGEVASLWKVCNGNTEALEYLKEFYNIQTNSRG